MLPDRVSNPGLLTYVSDALPIALRGPAITMACAWQAKPRPKTSHVSLIGHELIPQGLFIINFFHFNHLSCKGDRRVFGSTHISYITRYTTRTAVR